MSSPATHGQPALRDLLLDPTAVTYLMEFLERRRHSTRAQFWLLVEGLKDPLEELDVDLPTTTTGSSALDDGSIALDDIRMIWDAYLASDSFRSSKAHLETVRSFVVDRRDAGAASSSAVVTPQEVRQVRHALFAIQGDVLALLEEEDLPAFRRSDLHFKAVAAMPTSFAPPAAYITPPSPLATRPARPRSCSNPPVPPLRASSTPTDLVAAAPLGSPTFPPPRPASPALLGQSRTQRPQRTETAPPQVTFHAVAFDRPAARQPDLFDSGGGEPARFNPVRKVSNGSVDTVASAASAPTATATTASSSARRSRANLADSLEFLMSPQPEIDRSPLFGAAAADDAADDDDDNDNDGVHSDDDYVQVQTIEAIQEALNSILATDARAQPEASRSTASLASLQQGGSLAVGPAVRRVSADVQRKASLFATESGASSPSLPTSPVGTAPRGVTSPPALPPRPARPRGVFDDDETLDDVDVKDEADRESDFDPHDIVLPAPGDLHLPAEIARLAESLAKLKGQEAVVEALIRKAELTGNASELKLLVKSRDSLRREVRAVSFQKDQYEAQASENELTPDRTRVAIPGTTVGQAGGGTGSGSSSAATALAPSSSAQSFQLYLVEVHQLAPDGSFRAGWIVTRRYSEFSSLYGKLKDKYVAARYLDFPSKRLVGIWSKEFVEQRREGLERYLQVRLFLLLLRGLLKLGDLADVRPARRPSSASPSSAAAASCAPSSRSRRSPCPRATPPAKSPRRSSRVKRCAACTAASRRASMTSSARRRRAWSTRSSLASGSRRPSSLGRPSAASAPRSTTRTSSASSSARIRRHHQAHPATRPSPTSRRRSATWPSRSSASRTTGCAGKPSSSSCSRSSAAPSSGTSSRSHFSHALNDAVHG